MIIKEIRLTRTRPNPNKPDSGELWKDSAIAVVRENSYGSSLVKFDRLFEALQETFPDASKSSVNVVHYGGNRIKGTFDLEWAVFYDIHEAPEGWTAINELEYTL
jgi:hypothetical protein